MLTISVRDNENNKWKRNTNKKNYDRKEQEGKNYDEKVRTKWFCCAFKLGFLHLIYKALIFDF